MKKKAIIFGISGQDGAYLSKLLLEKKYKVYGVTRDISNKNLYRHDLLNTKEYINFECFDCNNLDPTCNYIKKIEPNEIYNFSSQSSVGISFQKPVESINSIFNSTLNILEAIRKLNINSKFYNSSSSEMFGDSNGKKISENSVFYPHSPYGVAKTSAHLLVESYRKSYRIFACSGILFNHESPLRSEEFVTQKVVKHAVSIINGKKKKLVLGNLNVKRDWGWAPEYVQGIWAMMQRKKPEDFILATGKMTSLEEFVNRTFNLLELDWKKFIEIDESLYRPFEIINSVGNPKKAKLILNWEAKLPINKIIEKLIRSEVNRVKVLNKEEKFKIENFF